ncbi:MAG: alpha-amylase family glycosyl hydrolase [Bacteroidales bacterium]|nr:alpha-amylase family glycosyl hydrolase [Bacteroidales bacterium]
MKKKVILTAALMACIALGADAKSKSPVIETSNDVILHAWCWSFNTIRENLADIAKAGYTIVQTSPAQQCVTEVRGDKGGGPQLFGKGKWYYQYQPTDWKIGNYQMGSAEDLMSLCEEAQKYGIRIIVDVLPNHTAIDDTRVSDALDAAVGGHDKLYHTNGFKAITDYNDRLQCTTGEMGLLPDVNTENPDFQFYYMTYVNHLLKCGVRGFRYDTAKHIGLPSDPKDPSSPENDFWEVALGRKAVKGLRLALPEDSLFVYGEVLQDKNVKETEYANYMKLTASNLGGALRNDLHQGNWTSSDVVTYHHPVDALKLITWVESHDTYCNEHESAGLSDQQIRLGWAYLTARQQGTPLFYSRPDGSDGPAGNYWGNNLVGARGNDNFKHPLVSAVNHFRAKMKGQPEQVSFSINGAVTVISRGEKGAVVINASDKIQYTVVDTTLPKGTYKDSLTGEKFKVKKGKLSGRMAPLSVYILEK